MLLISPSPTRFKKKKRSVQTIYIFVSKRLFSIYRAVLVLSKKD